MDRLASDKGCQALQHLSQMCVGSGGLERVMEGKSRRGKEGGCKHVGEWQRGQCLGPAWSCNGAGVGETKPILPREGAVRG